jgi:hypothetical protein
MSAKARARQPIDRALPHDEVGRNSAGNIGRKEHSNLLPARLAGSDRKQYGAGSSFADERRIIAETRARVNEL